MSGTATRLFIYAFLQFATVLVDKLDTLTPETVGAMLWPQWLKFWLAPTIAAVWIIRAFIDQSISRNKPKGGTNTP